MSLKLTDEDKAYAKICLPFSFLLAAAQVGFMGREMELAFFSICLVLVIFVALNGLLQLVSRKYLQLIISVITCISVASYLTDSLRYLQQ